MLSLFAEKNSNRVIVRKTNRGPTVQMCRVWQGTENQ